MAFRPAPGSALAESAGRRSRGGTVRPSTAGPNTPRVSSLGARREMFERAQPHVNIDRAEIACRRSHPFEYPAHQSASSSKVPGLHEAVDNTPAMWFAFRINTQDRSRDSRCFDFFPRRHTRRVSIHPQPSHRCHSPTAPTTRTGATNPAAASVSMSHTDSWPVHPPGSARYDHAGARRPACARMPPVQAPTDTRVGDSQIRRLSMHRELLLAQLLRTRTTEHVAPNWPLRQSKRARSKPVTP